MSCLLVILSSRVSLTNVARPTDDPPRRPPAVGGDATCPLANAIACTTRPPFAPRQKHPRLICDASRASNRSACRIDCVAQPSHRRRRRSCRPSDGTGRQCNGTTPLSCSAAGQEVTALASLWTRNSTQPRPRSVATRSTRQSCPAKRRSRCRSCPRRIWSWRARGAARHRPSSSSGRRRTGNPVAV